ncbi:MAG: prephenate dehydratase [Candidatus Anstonellales archaeon]
MLIAIIGAGNFGSFYASFFKDRGFDVIIAGRDIEKTKQKANMLSVSYASIEDAISKADVCIFTVSAKAMPAFIKQCFPYFKSNQLVIDFCSVKSHVIPVLRELMKEGIVNEIASMHPMHGPSIKKLDNVPILSIALKKGNYYERIKSAFLNEKALFYELGDENEHDKIVSYVQAFVHFYSLAGHTFLRQHIDYEKYGSVNFELLWNICSRIALQNPKLYAELQEINPYAKNVRKDFLLHISNIEKDIDKHFESLLNDAEYEKKKALFLSRTDRAASLIMEELSLKIATLGPEGSFSSLACDHAFAYIDGIKNKVLCNSIYDVINGHYDAMLLPIENSITGTIIEAIEGIENINKPVLMEVVLPISHSLAALKGHSSINVIYSHEQAFLQCSNFLKEHFPNAKWIKVNSTSYAGSIIIKNMNKHAAAIIREDYAKKLGLEIIARNIENQRNNMTRFWLIGNVKLKDVDKKAYKSSIVIEEAADRPGLLRDVLDVFAKRNINLSKLESRPSGRELGVYKFFIDVEAKIDGKMLNDMENELKNEVSFKLLGTYPVVEVENESVK